MREHLRITVSAIFLLVATTVEADVPMSPGTFFQPAVVESAREMMWLYPSSATLVLPQLNDQEEQEIANLIQDKRRTYVTIKRDVSVATSNWKLLGTKKTFNIWQLHIKSPDALGMQAFFYKAVLPPKLKIKIYSGQKAVTSHIDEYLGDTSTDPQNFWVTRVPGDTIVIEVWISQDSNLKPNTFPFEIKSINHYFRDVNGDLPSHSLYSEQQSQQAQRSQQSQQAQQLQQSVCSVFNDLCDFRDGRRVHRAIGYMLYTDPNDNTGTCTGGFLNNLRSDGALYFLTAFHCIYPGFSQNTQRGSDVDAEIYNSLSRCSAPSERLVGSDVKFIAASETADWALLWVNRSTLQRVDGLPFPATSPYLLGSISSTRLAVDDTLETLHHARSTIQNYAQFGVTAIENARAIDYESRAKTFFDSCQNIAGCTHYRIRAKVGGILPGASGSPIWNPRYRVRAVLTHGQDNRCVGFATRFDKIAEDGRVSCALSQGNRYYPQNTSNCDDSARPVYTNIPPSSRLSGLSLSTGTLHPSFDGSIPRYFAAVPHNTRQLTLRFSTEDGTANITVNGDPITKTATIPLSSGNNKITVKVQTADGNKMNTYIVDAIRLAQQNFNPRGIWTVTSTIVVASSSFSIYNFRQRHVITMASRKLTLTETVGSLPRSRRYSEIQRHTPNRYIFQSAKDINSLYPALETDATVDYILISDKEAIGTRFLKGSSILSSSLFTLRAEKLENTLKNIRVLRSVSELSSAFTSNIYSYSATVDSDVETFPISITRNIGSQSVTVNGMQDQDSEGLQINSFEIPLDVGNNTIVIEVKLPDYATSTYKLQVTRQSPALTKLSLSTGTLKPRFSGEITRYSATVASDIEQIILTPTVNSARHRVTITANGRSITGNSVPVNVGDNNIVISVSTRDNRATTTYTLKVTRRSPALTGLSLSSGTLGPSFSGEITRYAATVASDTERITLAPTANSARHRVTITANGSSITGNSVPVNVGNNNIVISVSTRDNRATTIYTLTVTRRGPTLTGLSLSTGTLNPSFSGEITRYAATVASDTERITLTPTANSARHRVTITANGRAITGNLVPVNVGDNNIVISVSTRDNQATTKYTLKVSRRGPTLTGLSLSTGTLNPSFSGEITRYTATVASDIERITLAPTADSIRHGVTITANGRAITRNSVPLNVGDNNIVISVSTRDNRATTTYTLKVTRRGPTLTGLSLSTGTLNPSFSGEIIRYSATVASDTERITLTPTANSVRHGVTITANGNSINTNSVPLNVDDNIITIAVKTQDNQATTTYTLVVTRLEPCLTDLSLSSGSLSPTFSDDANECSDATTQYAATVDSDIGEITLTPTANSVRHRVTITANGRSITGNAVPVNVGDNNIVISVSTRDNQATAKYTLRVTRRSPALTGLSLSSGTLNPRFNRGRFQYAATVASDIGQITLTPTANSAKHRIIITANGRSITGNSVPLDVGDNNIVILVSTRDDQATATYTLKVTRRSPALTGLSLSTGTLNPRFNRERFQYTATVASDIGEITLTPTANSVRHRVTITANGRSITGNAVPVNVGDNNIVISVSTRDDQATTKYTLKVTRRSPALTGLSLSTGTLNPSFSGEITRYAATVASDIGEITLTPTANSAKHRIIITANGSSITGDSVPLNVDDNTITIAVRTQDNQATTTYTLVVTRLKPCLTDLSLSSGSLSPIFGDANQCSDASTRYAATVQSDIEQITLTPAANSAKHRIIITANGSSITGSTVPVNVGDNNIVISVSTRDNRATTKYTLKVTRRSPALTRLSLSTGTLNPSFSGEITRYAATVASDIRQIRLTSTANSTRHRVTLTANGRSITGKTAPVNVGDNNIAIAVNTRDNRATTTYTLVVTRLEPCLTALALSSGSLSPTFSNPDQCGNASIGYAATVASDIKQIKLTLTANSAKHKVTIIANGRSITRNVVPLNVGNNTIVISVSTRDNQATTRYTLVVTRLEPCLTALALSPGSLSPNFGNPDRCNNASIRYAATVESDIKRIRLTPTANSARHKVSIIANGSPMTGKAVPVNVGDNTIVISVSTRDNQATTRYTLVVTRLEPCLTALSLSSGLLSSTFRGCSDETANYRATVKTNADQIRIKAKADRPSNKMTFNGERNPWVPLSVGDNTITVSVTTKDGTASKDYNLVVRRLSTATLTRLAVEANEQMLELKPNFRVINLYYRVNVENTMTTVTIRPRAAAGRTIRVRYTPDDGIVINHLVSSGDTVTIKPLFYGTNKVYIDVMHNDAMETYVLAVIIGIKLRIKVFLESSMQ